MTISSNTDVQQALRNKYPLVYDESHSGEWKRKVAKLSFDRCMQLQHKSVTWEQLGLHGQESWILQTSCVMSALDILESDCMIKDNPKYYVCKLSSTNTHVTKVIGKGRGLSFLRKDDVFDFSTEGFYDAAGQGRIYKATSDYDYKNKQISANTCYDPEI